MTDNKEEAKHWKAVADAQKEFEAVNKKITSGKGKAKAEDKQLPIFHTYKYSKPGLHEAAIVNGLPFFLKYDLATDRVMTVEKIEENSRVLIPPNVEEYPYTPYEFASAEELQQYLETAKHESIDSLYRKSKAIVKKYNDQDDYKLNIIAIDIVWSYFQDKFGTTHYLNIVGDNDSGKGSIGNTFEAVAYRAVNMTSPTAPNVFRTLGKIEPGQCTLVLDEADRIDQSTDMMNILKSGNDYTKRVPKTNTNNWRVEWFFAYCLKLVIAERSPSRFKAKGLLDRMLSVNTVPGKSDLDIKEVTNPRGEPELEAALADLLEFRKLMMVYRLIHFGDPVVDLDIGIERRNRELCKPYIRLFYGSQSQQEIEDTFQTFINVKTSKKAETLEAVLLPVVIDLVQKEGNQYLTGDLWKFITDRLGGELNPLDTNQYFVGEYTIYKNWITRFLEDKFGAGYKHTEKGGQLTFSLDKLQKISKSYELETNIKTKLKPDTTDSTDTILKEARSSKNTENLEDSQNTTREDVNISQNEGLEDTQAPFRMPSVSSLSSVPSGSPSKLSEEQKAKLRAKYDAARKGINRRGA
jgi:hypothetical protein